MYHDVINVSRHGCRTAQASGHRKYQYFRVVAVALLDVQAALPLAGLLPVVSSCGLSAAFEATTALDLEAKTTWPAMLLPWRSRLERKRSFAFSTIALSSAVSPRLPRLKLTCILLMMIFLYPSGLFIQKQRKHMTKFQLTGNFVVRPIIQRCLMFFHRLQGQ